MPYPSKIYVLEIWTFGLKSYTLAATRKSDLEIQKSKAKVDFVKHYCSNVQTPANEDELSILCEKEGLQFVELCLPDISASVYHTLDDIIGTSITPHLYSVNIGAVTLYFSYATLIAIYNARKHVFVYLDQNDIPSTTTTRHKDRLLSNCSKIKDGPIIISMKREQLAAYAARISLN